MLQRVLRACLAAQAEKFSVKDLEQRVAQLEARLQESQDKK